MGSLVRDAWVLLGLAFAQMFLTFLFAFFAPCALIVSRADSDPQLKANIEEMSEFAEENAEVELTLPEIMDQKGKTIAAIVSAVPWTGIVLLGSLVIYPFLGWWSARLLHHPQMGGLLVLGSVLTQQNIVMIPYNMEYRNLAPVALSMPTVMLFILLQFAFFTAGMLAQKGQRLVAESELELPVKESK